MKRLKQLWSRLTGKGKKIEPDPLFASMYSAPVMPAMRTIVMNEAPSGSGRFVAEPHDPLVADETVAIQLRTLYHTDSTS